MPYVPVPLTTPSPFSAHTKKLVETESSWEFAYLAPYCTSHPRCPWGTSLGTPPSLRPDWPLSSPLDPA